MQHKALSHSKCGLGVNSDGALKLAKLTDLWGHAHKVSYTLRAPHHPFGPQMEVVGVVFRACIQWSIKLSVIPHVG